MSRIYISADSFALAKGAEKVRDAFRLALKARGARVEVMGAGSRGMAWLEPLVEVETPAGRIGYGPVSASDVEALLDAGLLSGAAHALRVGVVDELNWMKRQKRLVFARCGLIDPLSMDDFRAHQGFAGLARAKEIGAAATVEMISKSGLRGRGGAGFPAGIKWKGAADSKAHRRFVVCNADEGDSGTFADRMLMEGDPLSLI